MFGPLASVTQTVADLDRSVAFYAEVLGLVPAAEGEVAGDRWLLPEGVTARRVELAAPDDPDRGRLRLLQCSVPGEPVRDRRRVQDPGWFAVNYRVDDAEAMWQRAMAAGAEPKSPPRLVSDAEFEGGSRVVDSQFYDPDGAVVDVFELSGAIDADVGTLRGPVSALQTMAIRCDAIDPSVAFYRQMGFEVWYDHRITDRNDFFGIPEGTWLHNVNLMHPAHPLGRVELAAIVGWTGADIAYRHRPPNLGYLWVTVPTADTEAGLEALGVPPLGRGDGYAFVTGPDGELVELAAE